MGTALRDKSFFNEIVRVSICCSTFNHSNFIEQCIEGFLDQECDFRVEIVIYDDASSDGTSEIVKSYSDRHPSIFRTLLQSENQFSKGVDPYSAYVFPAAKGEYIAICDGDDYWSDPQKLAQQVMVLDSDASIAITYGAVRAVTQVGVLEDFQNGVERDLTPGELRAGSPINTLTTCFRNIFQGVGPPLSLKRSPVGDLMTWGMLGYHGSGRFLAGLPRANYRVHLQGVMSMQTRQKQLLMTAIAQLTLAAYHAENEDETSSQNAIELAIKYLNKTKIVHFVVKERVGAVLLEYVRRWYQKTRRRRN